MVPATTGILTGTDEKRKMVKCQKWKRYIAKILHNQILHKLLINIIGHVKIFQELVFKSECLVLII